MAQLIPSLVGTGASLIGSFLSGKPKTTTSTQTGTMNQTNTSTPTFTPEGLQLQRQLLDYQSSLTRDPAAGTGAINSAGVNQINRNYDALPGRISTQLASRGFGSSGQAGDQFYQAGNDRLNNLSNFQSQMNQLILNRQSQGAALGTDLLNANRGTTSNISGTSSGTGTSTGPDTSASNLFGTLAGAASSASPLNSLAQLLMLSKTSQQPGVGSFMESGG